MIRKLNLRHRKLFVLFALTVLFLLLGIINLRAQAVIGARELAMGQATTALQNTSWGMFANPALMQQDERSVSFYGVRYFGLAEVSDMAASISHPTTIGVFGVGAHRYGFDLFNESRLRLGYKNSFMGFHYGGILNYSHVAQGGGYGSAGAFGVDLGVAASIVTNLWLGAKATNINRPKYGSRNDEKLPSSLSVGLSYQLSEVALIATEIYKDVQFPISYRGGIEVRIVDELVGRAGITTKPQTFSAGVGYSGSFWGINIAVQRHENRALGYSPAIDFKIIW